MEEIVYSILQHPDVITARKDVNVDGTPYVGGHDQVSEWAVAMALSQYPIGTQVLESEFQKTLHGFMVQQTLIELSEKGLIDMMFDEKCGEVVYKLSELGKKAGEELDHDGQVG